MAEQHTLKDLFGNIRMKKRRRKKGRYQRGTYTSIKTGEVCNHRSGWERLYMKWLDEQEDVISWSYEKVVIAYVSNVRSGKLRKYYPDFCIEMSSGSKRIVEVKPKRKMLQPTIVKKTNAAIEWCSANGHTFEFVTEVELKALGLL